MSLCLDRGSTPLVSIITNKQLVKLVKQSYKLFFILFSNSLIYNNTQSRFHLHKTNIFYVTQLSATLKIIEMYLGGGYALKNQIEQLQHYIHQSKKIAFFGGAGVSTESGLPDYRSQEGTYTKMEEKQLNPKIRMSKRFMLENPEEFFKPRDNQTKPFIPEPNAGHRFLAELEKQGKDVRIITQNVDGLHQKAGSKLVVELHGNNRHFYCMECGREYPYNEIPRDNTNVPRCPIDNGIIRADVILFGENLKPGILDRAKELIAGSDLLIIAGTSLSVYPAKTLIRHFTGSEVVVINQSPLKIKDVQVDLTITEPVGETFSKLTVHA